MHETEQPTGFFTTDTALIVRTWDTWLAGATGISADQAQGRALIELFPDFAARGLMTRFQQVIEQGAVYVLAPAFHRYLVRCAPQAPSRHFDAMQQRATLAPLRDNERIVGVLVSVEDVTARRERERDLADDLASSDETVRLIAAEALAQEEAAEDALIGVLGDTSWRVRQAAAGGLAQRGGTDVLETLVHTLHRDHQNPSVLNSALHVLARTPEDAVTPLAALLRSPDADLRSYVALALGDRGDLLATPALIGALEDDDANVRYHVIEALGKLRASEAAEALASIAETRDFFLAFAALDALAMLGNAAAAARIVPLLDDILLSAAVARVLGSVGDLTVIEPLGAALDAPDAPILDIVQALATVARRFETTVGEGADVAQRVRAAITPAGARHVLAALPSAPTETLPALTLLLSLLDDTEAQGALVRLLAEPNVRGEAIEALVQHGGRVTHLLEAQLTADTAETREAAAVALGRIGSPHAVPALLRALHAEPELAVVAVGALAKIGDGRAFEPLLALLGDPRADVRQAVVGALNSLGHPDTAARVEQSLVDPNPRVRESAVKIAGYFGYRTCVAAVFERCHDGDELVRRAAFEALPFLDDQRVLPVLSEAVRHETSTVRAAAARALGYTEGYEAVAALGVALADEDMWVRYYAARALGQHAAPETVETLAEVARTDPAPPVRIAAVGALGDIGDEQAAAVLQTLARATESELAHAALDALRKSVRS